MRWDSFISEPGLVGRLALRGRVRACEVGLSCWYRPESLGVESRYAMANMLVHEAIQAESSPCRIVLDVFGSFGWESRVDDCKGKRHGRRCSHRAVDGAGQGC